MNATYWSRPSRWICSVTADGEEEFFETLEYDNQDRVIARYRYASSANDPDNLRAKSTTEYDARGRVFRSTVFAVDPEEDDIGPGLATKTWYDARGQVLKTAGPSGAFRKQTYDGAGRVKASFVSYDTDASESVYAAAATVTGDIVVSQSEFTRDDSGNLLLETRWERKSTATGADALTTSSAVRYYQAFWYDALNRLTATADYGTNGGSNLTRPSSPPSPSDTVLVETMVYDADGRLAKATSPGGKDATLTRSRPTKTPLALPRSSTHVDCPSK